MEFKEGCGWKAKSCANCNLDIACCNLAQDLLFLFSFWDIVCSSKENTRKEH